MVDSPERSLRSRRWRRRCPAGGDTGKIRGNSGSGTCAWFDGGQHKARGPGLVSRALLSAEADACVSQATAKLARFAAKSNSVRPCPEWDSNPHAFRHVLAKHTRLPVPPSGHVHANAGTVSTSLANHSSLPVPGRWHQAWDVASPEDCGRHQLHSPPSGATTESRRRCPQSQARTVLRSHVNPPDRTAARDLGRICDVLAVGRHRVDHHVAGVVARQVDRTVAFAKRDQPDVGRPHAWRK